MTGDNLFGISSAVIHSTYDTQVGIHVVEMASLEVQCNSIWPHRMIMINDYFSKERE